MKLLLDTCVLIWACTGDDHLSDEAKALIKDRSNVVYYSAVSVFECEVKFELGRSTFTFSGVAADNFARAMGFVCLNVEPKHAIAMGTLRYPAAGVKPHHDPFDRLLLAQAKSEGMMFMTHDTLIPNYGELCIMSV